MFILINDHLVNTNTIGTPVVMDKTLLLFDHNSEIFVIDKEYKNSYEAYVARDKLAETLNRIIGSSTGNKIPKISCK